MDRACGLAKQYGIGLVALGNNNHWLRGAAYGFQAAERGMIGICWTNSQPNMPAWGAKDRRIGNNPIVFAVPRSSGKHIVADCAMSQFSYGALESARMKGEKMPIAAGYDTKGELTTDPAEIEKTWRILPTGYWKGRILEGKQPLDPVRPDRDHPVRRILCRRDRRPGGRDRHHPGVYRHRPRKSRIAGRERPYR